MLVDGSGVGDVGEAVLRDRKALSADGIMMVVVTVDSEEARIIAGPDLISKGVFYLPESGGVLDELRGEFAPRSRTRRRRHARRRQRERAYPQRSCQSRPSRTKRRPVVIPVVMEV